MRQELKKQRQYNKKIFQVERDTFVMEAHAGYIHYFNKLGEGDGEVRFREIDFTLNEVRTRQKTGWTFKYNSFQPFLPEYSDEWVEFRDLYEGKDQIIRYRAHADHVKGIFVHEADLEVAGLDKLTQSNCVIYPNAFGEGVDYILYFIRSGLAKVVRIREDYKKNKNYNFDFDFEYEDMEVKRGTKDKVEYVLDKSKDKEFDTNKQTLVGNDRDDGKEWNTYLKSFRAWDSNNNSETIKVKFKVTGKKSTLTKIVPASFIESSRGDVYTDTTTSYYASDGDGSISYSNSTWSTCRTASSGSSVDNSNYGTTRSGKHLTTYAIYRSYMPVDTSGIPSSATISAATVYVDYDYKTNSENDGSDFLRLVQSTQASTTTLVTSDYSKIGSTAGASDKDIGTISLTGFTAWEMNATGLTWIDKEGYTKLGWREGHDVTDDTPADGSSNYNDATWLVASATSNDGYISVTYTVAPVTDERDAKISGVDVDSNIKVSRIAGGDGWYRERFTSTTKKDVGNTTASWTTDGSAEMT